MSQSAPTVRLAHTHGAQGDNILLGRKGVAQIGDESKPALLVSFVYLSGFLRNKAKYAYRDWVLDSGAFSAYNSGTVISLSQYIDACQQLLATDPTLTEVYALDVIGDWRGSLRNYDAMLKAGVPAIPTFHATDPPEMLAEVCAMHDKIAVGGCVGMNPSRRIEVAAQVFARVWPKKIHGFGYGMREAIMALPFHSVDATTWQVGPCRFGRWEAYGGKRLSIRGSSQNLRAELEHYLRMEREARSRWKREMALLETAQ